ncbi:C13 family peptidase [Coralloluteibacterium thermophilus]|uniref:C13 family peptidase n=1 Tax=Coralloluteibacterium thermophilum TaxID=2707049 RepID=A0ABV9NPQ8_9GAMM
MSAVLPAGADRAGTAGGRLLAQALSLGILRRPRRRLPEAGIGTALVAALAAALLAFGLDTLATPAPRLFLPYAIHGHALDALAALLAGWLVARILGRPTRALAIAAVLLVAQWPVILLMWGAGRIDALAGHGELLFWSGVALDLLVLACIVAHAAAGADILRRMAAWLVLVLLWLAPSFVLPNEGFWYALDEDQAQGEPAGAPAFDAEVAIYRQQALIEASLAALRPQTPGRPDLYAIGLAGDGRERVFRNEVDFLSGLLGARFGAEGRVLRLVNSPETVDSLPLASLGALRQAVQGVAARMDREEDILLLFMTSHGLPGGRFHIDMAPLPLVPITAPDLRAVLDDAGIRWRVIVVSACYSGGFIDALADPRTLVVTAARADRTSFGCGTESDITWFGHAFLYEGLNRSTSFAEAFAHARGRIAEWEAREDMEASHPQYVAGAEIEAHLEAWRRGLPDAPPVPYVVPLPDEAAVATAGD